MKHAPTKQKQLNSSTVPESPICLHPSSKDWSPTWGRRRVWLRSAPPSRVARRPVPESDSVPHAICSTHHSHTHSRTHTDTHSHTYIGKWIHLCMYRGERQVCGEYVNRNWNSLHHHQLATFIKSMGKELVNGRECKMATPKTPPIRLLNSIKQKVLLYLLTQRLEENIKQYAKILFCSVVNTLPTLRPFF